MSTPPEPVTARRARGLLVEAMITAIDQWAATLPNGELIEIEPAVEALIIMPETPESPTRVQYTWSYRAVGPPEVSGA